MQPEKENVAFDLRSRRAERGPTERDAPKDTRDRTIAELKSQVTFLRRELSRRDDVLMFLAGMAGSHPGRAAPETPEAPPSAQPRGPRPTAPARPRDGARRGSRPEAEKREWPALPEGYRVVATASDAWVLVARGVRVAGYRGVLDRGETARDAWEHQRRNGG